MHKPNAQIRTLIVALSTLSSVIISLIFTVTVRPVNARTGPMAESDKTRSELPVESANARALEAYGKLPLSFEANVGQSHESVKFLSRGKGYTLFLTATEAVMVLRDGTQQIEPNLTGKKQKNRAVKSAVLRMKLLGARPDVAINGQQALEGKVNYLLGNDRAKWQQDVSTYLEVRYEEVWPGIDMVWHRKKGELEYDFIVKPGVDASQIQLRFEGADKLRIDPEGNLVALTKAGEVVQHAPVIYQDGAKGLESISGKYKLNSEREVSFEVGPYDETRSLVIDPLLVYSTYLGGSSSEWALGVSVDSIGQAFITGAIFIESDFPAETSIGFDADACFQVFVTKLTADGRGTIYSTIIGPTAGGDGQGVVANDIAVTSDGKACITGHVDNFGNNSEFPVTDNAYQENGVGCLGASCQYRDNRLCDAFVTVLNAEGNSLFYSTFFGGDTIFEFSYRGYDNGLSIAVDSSNHVYITGSTSSNNLPTKNAFQDNRQSDGEGDDAFIAVFDPSGERGRDTLLYSSYLGGEGDDVGRGIAVDGDRNAYVGGSTASRELRTKSPSSLAPLQENFQGSGYDGFLAKVDTQSEGNDSLTYLTYFGGNGNDRVESVAVDSFQRAYITGASISSPASFPLLNAFDSVQSNGEAFVAKLNADGTALFYCSFLGGENGNTSEDGEEGLDIAIDTGGNAYVTGRTTSGESFPVGALAPPFPANLQGTAFVAKIEASVVSDAPARLLYSTTFGGKAAFGNSLAVDSGGNVYLAGSAGEDLPTTAGAFQSEFNGGFVDGFVAKIAANNNDTIGVYRPSTNQFLLRNSNTAGPADITIPFGLAGDLPVTGDWDGNGIDDVGIFRPSTGQFRLRLPDQRPVIITLTFGEAGDLPVAGDWNGDGIDTPGVFRPSIGAWILTNGPNIDNTSPPVNFSFSFGQNGDTPIVGDWNGDGFDTPGLFRNGVTLFILSNGFQGVTDITPFALGALGSLALAGDWDGDGVATIGVFNPNTGQMALNNTNTSGNGLGDLIFTFGQNGDLPLAGDWDGKPSLPSN